MSQIKSKLRVKELAEVYTNEREVNSMLDLVKEYSYDIEKRFLEPACGNGNFLIKILERKLKTVKELYSHKSLKEYEFNVCLALSSMYGVDICPENVHETKERLFHRVFDEFYLSRNTDFPNPKFAKSVYYILHNNIICGNTLKDLDMRFTEFKKGKKKFSFLQKRFFFKELFNEQPKQYYTLKEKDYLNIGGI